MQILPLTRFLWFSQRSWEWWAARDWWSGWTFCVFSGMKAQPSPRPLGRHRSAAGCPARIGPGCRTGSTPRKRSAGARYRATSTRRTASNSWKSCSASGDSWPAPTVCRPEPPRLLSRGDRNRASRVCFWSPAVKAFVSETKHPVGSGFRSIWSLAILRPPGSRCIEAAASPASERWVKAKQGRCRHFLDRISRFKFTQLGQ